MLVCSAQASSFSLYLRAAQPARQVVAADMGALGVDVVEPDHERDHLLVERRDAALEGLQNVRGGVPADTGVDHHIHVASQLKAQPFVEYLRVVPVAMRMQGPMRDTCTAKQPGLRLRVLEDGLESLHVVLNSRIL